MNLNKPSSVHTNTTIALALTSLWVILCHFLQLQQMFPQTFAGTGFSMNLCRNRCSHKIQSEQVFARTFIGTGVPMNLCMNGILQVILHPGHPLAHGVLCVNISILLLHFDINIPQHTVIQLCSFGHRCSLLFLFNNMSINFDHDLNML